ncbi:MAG: Si-specific NAD(P)(+) transhydrogenase [Myxococcota bacterium]
MSQRFDWVVIGAGPAGQKAAIQAAKAGYSVAIVERGSDVGGECVHRGTIPSKALREAARRIAVGRESLARVAELPDEVPMEMLLSRVTDVIEGHVRYQTDQVTRNGIVIVRGRARFEDAHRLTVQGIRERHELTAEHFVIATGSVPRHPPGFPVDHERVLDSDSILQQPYLPKRLVVIGGGVVACEYATIFQHLGTEVTMIDKASHPLGFMDNDLTQRLVERFKAAGGRIVTETTVVRMTPSFGSVELELLDGSKLQATTVLLAMGRVANVHHLGLETLPVDLTQRGHIEVDDKFRTSVPHILAVGDAIGFPAMAATSMEQGRRAVRMAVDLPVEDVSSQTPMGIYTIPELAGIGLTEAQALKAHDEIRVGICNFTEVARGQIADLRGMLKLITTANGSRILGVHIIGEGATDLVHVGQMAMLGGLRPEVFVDNTFNFPTLAEAYRVAALALHKPTALRSALVPA